MPSNKHAAFRYRVLDRCFRQHRNWSMDELIEHVSEQLSEHFKPGTTITKRTIQADIHLMKGDPPKGWNAPIKCDKSLYFYTDRSFSIEKTGLLPQEVNAIREAVTVLRQFQGLPQVKALSAVLDRIEGAACYSNTDVIQFESNEQVQGLEHLAPLYDAVVNKKAVLVRYHPYTHPEPMVLVFHPYLLKEYRNRWFVFGCHEGKGEIWNLALDRILSLSPSFRPYLPNTDWDPEAHFRDIVGVTLHRDRVPQEVRFEVSPLQARYLISKPLHHSQKILQESPERVVFSLWVVPNYELEAELARLGISKTVV